MDVVGRIALKIGAALKTLLLKVRGTRGGRTQEGCFHIHDGVGNDRPCVWILQAI